MMMGRAFIAVGVAACVGATGGCDRKAPPQPAPSAAAPTVRPASLAERSGFLKGQLHMHSNSSGDSETPPEQVVRWYDERGYDFVVFTDHNFVTRVAGTPRMLVLPGVELTQNLRSCDPPPEPADACLLHVDALFVDAPHGRVELPTTGSRRRLDLFGLAVDRTAELRGIAQLNHPNFHWAADAELLVTLAARGVALVEIANMAVDSRNEGDARHPSTEALWDAALAKGARVFATATDDAHHYYDADVVRARRETAYTGDRGFVMVRAERSPEAIRAAVARGDFYASTGLLLDRVELSPSAIEIAVAAGETATFEVIGSGGTVLQSVSGAAVRFDPTPSTGGTVRVRVTDARGRRAWTQPVWLSAGR